MTKLKRLLSQYGVRWLIGLALIIIAALQARAYLPTTLVDRIDTFLYDARTYLEPAKYDPRIVIVDIDEKSLDEIGQWPWKRNVVGDLVTRLSDDYHAKAVGFDIVFSEPDSSSGYHVLQDLAATDLKHVPEFKESLPSLKHKLDSDAQFAQALANRPVVMGFVLFNGTGNFSKGALPRPAFTLDDLNGIPIDALASESYTANLTELQGAAAAGGFFTPHPDDDGVIRRLVLMAQIGDGYYESLALATARVALKGMGISPEFPDDLDNYYGDVEAIRLHKFPNALRVKVEPYLTELIWYRGEGGPKGGTFRYISAADVLKGRVSHAELDKKIILVGTTASGLKDLRTAPMRVDYPGVEMHANVIASILDGKFKTRLTSYSEFELLQSLILGLALMIMLPMMSPAKSLATTLGALALTISLNLWAYREYDTVLPVANALLLIAALFIINITWGYLFEYRKGKAMAGLFGEYVAPELVEQMAKDPENYNMEGHSRVLTVMFSDVRGFTTISESLDPNTLREYVNLYLTAMSEEIRGNRGTLDKYIGDAVMAFWGAPVELPDHASRAVDTALKMQATAKKLNADFVARGWPPLKIGIGLNTGEMRVGDMGSKIRRAYTVMGDAVNLSARLEGITKVYGVGVLVGEATKTAAPEFVYQELDRVRVKGKNEPVPIFEPLCRRDALSDGLRLELSTWTEALNAVRSQQWTESERLLTELHDTHPDKLLYALYIERVAHYREHSPGENWDGVTTFDTK
jgi:adenylate cyclase